VSTELRGEFGERAGVERHPDIAGGERCERDRGVRWCVRARAGWLAECGGPVVKAERVAASESAMGTADDEVEAGEHGGVFEAVAGDGDVMALLGEGVGEVGGPGGGRPGEAADVFGEDGDVHEAGVLDGFVVRGIHEGQRARSVVRNAAV